MSDVSQGPGWWIASDGKWYAPELAADYVPPTPAVVESPTSAPALPLASEPPPLPDVIAADEPPPLSDPVPPARQAPIAAYEPAPVLPSEPPPLVESAPEPMPEPIPEPVPEPVPAPEPMPEPIPEPVVESATSPAPDPEPVPVPESTPSAEPAWTLPTNAPAPTYEPPTYEPPPAYEPAPATASAPEPVPAPTAPTAPSYEPTPLYQPESQAPPTYEPTPYEPTPLPQTQVIPAVSPVVAAAAMTSTAPPTEQWNLPAPPGPPGPPVAQPMAPQAPPVYNAAQPMGGVVKKGPWNFGAGLVFAEFVIATMFAISNWATLASLTLPQDIHDIMLTSAIITVVGAVVSLLAVVMLAGRRAWGGLLALLAGVTSAVGVLWPRLDDWSNFTAQGAATIISILGQALIPAVVGLFALGLRRIDLRRSEQR